MLQVSSASAIVEATSVRRRCGLNVSFVPRFSSATTVFGYWLNSVSPALRPAAVFRDLSANKMAASERGVEQASELLTDSFASLTDEEVYWRDRQRFLESQGYMLRPRYRPDWTPSWRGKPPDAVLDAEDAFALKVSHSLTVRLLLLKLRRLKLRISVMDATRISDGLLVYVKRTPTDSQELQILSYLNSNEVRQDPRNRCVPLLDVLRDPSTPETSFMVMPFLRYIDIPPMERIEDVLDCFDQVLEVSVSMS